MISRRRTKWTREQIQTARRSALPALLRARGFDLRETGAGNYRITQHPDIIIKAGYWRSGDCDKAGNAIDFFVTVLGMSFNEAMNIIIGANGLSTG